MSSEQITEIYRQHRTAQDKYSYFLLAAAASAVAFALTRTQETLLSWSMLPLGGATICWGLSFFFGCRQLGYVMSSLYSNQELLKIQSGNHPAVGQHPGYIAAASEGILKAIEHNSDKVSLFANMQFWFLIWGAISYIVWHVFEMYIRTVRA